MFPQNSYRYPSYLPSFQVGVLFILLFFSHTLQVPKNWLRGSALVAPLLRHEPTVRGRTAQTGRTDGPPGSRRDIFGCRRAAGKVDGLPGWGMPPSTGVSDCGHQVTTDGRPTPGWVRYVLPCQAPRPSALPGILRTSNVSTVPCCFQQSIRYNIRSTLKKAAQKKWENM